VLYRSRVNKAFADDHRQQERRRRYRQIGETKTETSFPQPGVLAMSISIESNDEVENLRNGLRRL